jgi:magnesium-protoporphyrin O-methyltransferase
MALSTHKQQLLEYFDGLGFERWQAIYGDAKLSRVRQTIRAGHQQMLDSAINWLMSAGDQHILDAGCGTGLLTLALARRGQRVTAIDLAPHMAIATQQAVREAGVAEAVTVHSGDLEVVSGRYDAVACLDVLIHYPVEDARRMLTQLASMARGPLIFTYAPHEELLAALHWLGGHFPKAHKRTDIQMIAEHEIVAMLANCGRSIRRTTRISHGFYHVALVEAVPDR